MLSSSALLWGAPHHLCAPRAGAAASSGSHPGATGYTPAQLLKAFLCSCSVKCTFFFFASVKCNCGKIWKCFLLFHRKDPVLQRSPAGQPSAAVGTFMKRGQGRRRESYTPAAEWGLGLPSTLLPKMFNGSLTSSIFTSLGWKWGTPLKIKGWTIAPNRLCFFTTMHAFLPS